MASEHTFSAANSPTGRPLFMDIGPGLAAAPRIPSLNTGATDIVTGGHTSGHVGEDQDDVYESLPSHVSAWHHMAAGGIAGVMEHTIMYPVDVIKVSFCKCFDHFKDLFSQIHRQGCRA